ncbi:LOG family protein [Lacunimicrobium album]
MLKSICVFCGSRSGNNPAYVEAARQLATVFCTREQALIYGGGSVGLMGVLADTMLENGGEVIGVIPQFLATKELLHAGVVDMRIVDSMHTRKATMASLADAFIALPGGFGTFEELLEMITWSQLGIHRKPIGILNTDGFYDNFIAFLQTASENDFFPIIQMDLFVVKPTVESLLQSMDDFVAPTLPKFASLEKT